MKKVLVLEDESSIRGFIVINLRRAVLLLCSGCNHLFGVLRSRCVFSHTRALYAHIRARVNYILCHSIKRRHPRAVKTAHHPAVEKDTIPGAIPSV